MRISMRPRDRSGVMQRWRTRIECRRPGRGMTVVIAVVVVVSGVVALRADPVANADDIKYEAFYTPPQPLPAGKPGDLIRTEPLRLVLEPSGQLGSFVGTGTRIMYRGTDAQSHPVAVTGAYIEPDVPWPGSGPRPLIAYATGPYGVGEQCAPSRLFDQGIHFSQGFDLMFNYEEGFIATLLARGFAIVVTDGVGRYAWTAVATVLESGCGRYRVDRRGEGSPEVAGNVSGSAWSGGVLGLGVRWAGVAVGGRVGAVVCSRTQYRGYLRQCAADPRGRGHPRR